MLNPAATFPRTPCSARPPANPATLRPATSGRDLHAELVEGQDSGDEQDHDLDRPHQQLLQVFFECGLAEGPLHESPHDPRAAHPAARIASAASTWKLYRIERSTTRFAMWLGSMAALRSRIPRERTTSSNTCAARMLTA